MSSGRTPTCVWVTHAAGRYPVYIGKGLLGKLPQLAEELLPDRRLVVITDRTVARAVGHPLLAPTLVVPAGEASKSRTRWQVLTDKLLDLGYGRDSGIVAVGGGVVGDLAGFVAATYLRGIPYLQVPTTLLAMVDASVGGKTAVNTRHGKNLVGAFHPPVGVVADPDALASLPTDRFRAGLAEAVKHGLVADGEYFAWLEGNVPAILARDPETLTRLVEGSVAIKARVVSADERESGQRAWLNAGHTVGHALESSAEFAVSHGDAVALGLVAETLLAESLGVARAGLSQRVAGLLAALGLPVVLPQQPEDDALLAAMRHDKKGTARTLRFALPARVGNMGSGAGGWTVPVDEEGLRKALGSARRGVPGVRLSTTHPQDDSV